jgi:DNA repair protein RecO (recombination protein O)
VALYQTEGIILSQMPLGEQDKIVTLLSPEEGLVRAVVKGARKATSRLSAVTQPFTRASFQLNRGKSLDRVTQVSLKTTHPGILSDYGRVVCASYLSELVSEFASEREADRERFRLFSTVLDCVEEREDLWTVVKWAEIGLLARAGVLPSFNLCVLCGGELSPPAVFSAGLGGPVCGKCGHSDQNADPASGAFPGILVTAGTLKTIHMLSESKDTCPNLTARGKVREEVNQTLEQCLDYALGKRLNSSLLVGSILVGPNRGS